MILLKKYWFIALITLLAIGCKKKRSEEHDVVVMESHTALVNTRSSDVETELSCKINSNGISLEYRNLLEDVWGREGFRINLIKKRRQPFYSFLEIIKKEHGSDSDIFSSLSGADDRVIAWFNWNTYLRGKEYDFALKWLQKDSENPDAQEALGQIYMKGLGVDRDITKAEKWFLKASKNDNPQAKFNLGIIYFGGRGITKSPEKALQYFNDAASHGNIPATFFLGGMYAGNMGIPPDLKKSFYWYHKSAKQGYSRSMYTVAMLYKLGRGIGVDFGKYIFWLKKAAESDSSDAQELIANEYIQGKYLKKDYIKAYAWLGITKVNGKDNKKIRLALEKELTVSEIDESKKESKQLMAIIEEQKKKEPSLFVEIFQ